MDRRGENASAKRHIASNNHINRRDSRCHNKERAFSRRKSVRRRRRKAIRRLIVTAFMVILFFSVMQGFISLAKETRREDACSVSDSDKYYKTIIIRPGETLWNIAETYCTDDYETLTDYIDALKNMNHLKGDTIYAGERILVICQNLNPSD